MVKLTKEDRQELVTKYHVLFSKGITIENVSSAIGFSKRSIGEYFRPNGTIPSVRFKIKFNKFYFEQVGNKTECSTNEFMCYFNLSQSNTIKELCLKMLSLSDEERLNNLNEFITCLSNIKKSI